MMEFDKRRAALTALLGFRLAAPNDGAVKPTKL